MVKIIDCYEYRARKNAKNAFEKYFFRLINNEVFGRTKEKRGKNRNISLVTTKARKNYLMSESSYQKTNLSSEYSLAVGVEKGNKPINNRVYLDFTILEARKTVMYVFCYGYVKVKHEKTKRIMLHGHR